MRAVGRQSSFPRQAIVWLAVFGLAVPAGLTFLDAATRQGELSGGAASNACEEVVWGDFEANLVGDLAIAGAAHSSSCDVGVVILLGAEMLPLSSARKQEVFVRGGCRPNTTFGNASLA